MMEAVDLRCEYAVNPLGIEVARPRLMWKLVDPQRGQTQSAYQVRAATTPEALTKDAPDLWGSGKVSAGPGFATYGGPALHSAERCYWQVRVWDVADVAGPYSAPAWFEMGLLAPEDWDAEWLGFPASAPGRAVYLRRDFRVAKPVVRARAYVAGLGYHELRLNGAKVGDAVLEPGTTAYDKHVLYVTHDVTSLLAQGENVVACVLGSGWYGTPKLLLRLNIDHEDGTRTVVTSGNSRAPWRVEHGPIIEQSIYNGEVYDARLERPGWDTPYVEGESVAERPAVWVMALVTEAPGGRLVPQMQEPIRVMGTLTAQSVREPQPGLFVMDFGQNIAGWARLRVEGPRGTRITLRFAESLYADGTVNQENLRSAAATDVYILKGKGVEEWEPRFTYHGFRYVQVEGYPGAPSLDDVVARIVRSSMAVKGSFVSDNELLNRIHHLVQWTETSNLHSVPTDCPQRDERMGWLNDMAARSEELVHNFEVSRFLPKWIRDIADAQDPRSGAITDTVPFHWGSRPADPVSVCYILIPWLLYMHNGDLRTLSDAYDGMRHWLDFLTSRTEAGIVQYSYYGDWAPPVAEGLEGGSPVSRNTPGTLISTALYIHGLDLFARIAGVLGKDTDRRAYTVLAERSREAYNLRFWDEAAGGYGSNNQACNAVSLYMGLVPPERRPQVLANLVRDVTLHEGHLTTGNLCTKYLLEVLTAGGHSDVATAIATQESYPSWGFMLANGATTVWERWELATGGGMNSHNHPMYASVGAWLYRGPAGITLDADGAGWTRFTVCPHPVEGLTHVEAALETIRGHVAVDWTQLEEAFELRFTVPVGSRARVQVPMPEGAARRILEGQTVVWGEGAAERIPGLITAGTEPGYVVLEVGSGEYCLVSSY